MWGVVLKIVKRRNFGERTQKTKKKERVRWETGESQTDEKWRRVAILKQSTSGNRWRGNKKKCEIQR